jgi:hypothetical protein
MDFLSLALKNAAMKDGPARVTYANSNLWISEPKSKINLTACHLLKTHFYQLLSASAFGVEQHFVVGLVF